MRWQTARDVMLFFAGLGVIAHEVVVATVEREAIILAALVMMGVVPFARFLDKLNGGADDK